MSDPRVAAIALIDAAIAHGISIDEAMRARAAPIPQEAIDWALRHLPPLRIAQGRVFVHAIAQLMPVTWLDDEAISADGPPCCRTDYPATVCPCGAVRVRWAT